MIGIYDCFGYGLGYDVSFEERYRLIKEAGFDCVMLWWSDKFGRGIGYQREVSFSRNAGRIRGIKNTLADRIRQITVREGSIIIKRIRK